MGTPALHRTATLLLAALLAAITGCAERSTEPAAPPPQRVTTGTSEPATGSPSAAEPAPLADLRFGLTPIARGLEHPLLVTNAGDGSGRLFIVEQAGIVRVIRDGALAERPYLDVRHLVSAGGERGLLGLAFDPQFASNGRLYVNYTDRSGDTVVARFTVDDPASDRPRATGPDVLLRVEQPYSNHNGGNIVFGPDGLLWIGMGDGGSAGDPEDRAQDPRSLLGKMLTLDVRQPNAKPRVVVSGLRNPWRFSFDRATGDLWIGDVGQNAWEEIDHLPTGSIVGSNLGWNRWEGNHPYPPGTRRSRAGFTFPLLEYGHETGRSVTGGHVYRGRRFPWLSGAYLYADFEAGWVAALRTERAEGAVKVAEQRVVLRDVGLCASLGEDENGEVYLCDWQNGVVSLITAAPSR